MKRGDRRSSKRITYVCEVECEGAGRNYLAARINDLSLAGAFIDSVTCYAPGTSLRLRFHINDTLIETTAEVRYTIPQMGMGVRFLRLNSHHLTALKSLFEGQPLIPSDSEPHLKGGTRTWNMPDTLLGNFAIVSMFDVVQIIENNRLSGVLAVMSPVANGEVQFTEGKIVGAHSGSRIGIDVLKSFLDVAEGSFEFKRSDTHYPPTIHAPSNMSLMLDLLRVTDEEAGALS